MKTDERLRFSISPHHLYINRRILLKANSRAFRPGGRRIRLFCCYWKGCVRRGTGQTIQIYDIFKTYLEQPEQQMRLTVKAQIEDKDAGFTAKISRVPAGDAQITAISEGGRRLYYSEGAVFLENGAAFRLSSGMKDRSLNCRRR